MQLKDPVKQNRGVVSLRALKSEGIPLGPAQLERLGFSKVRPGWYAWPNADPHVVEAVSVGGALTCTSVLSGAGVWRPHGDECVHVRFARHPVPRNVKSHVLPGRRIPVTAAIDTPSMALRAMSKCLEFKDSVAVVDSLLREARMRPHEIASALEGSAVGRKILRAADPSAESGAETHMRLLLRSLRLKFRCQVFIAGVGRTDFLVGDRLVIEVDGLAHHSGHHVQRDRNRDNALTMLGFRCLRFTYWDVVLRPDYVESVILGEVRRGEHRWRTGRASTVVPQPTTASPRWGMPNAA